MSRRWRTAHERCPTWSGRQGRSAKPAAGATTPRRARVLDREHCRLLLREMLRIRRFEERAAELYSLTKIRGFLHLYIGEEAVAVGVMQALTPTTRIVATYREHGQALARGVPAGSLMAEMFGKVERLQSRSRRLDALLRRLASLLRRLRDRRRRPADRGRARARRQAAEARCASPPASSATALSPRASSTSRSTSPRSGSCRCSSSARTTCTRWGRRSCRSWRNPTSTCAPRATASPPRPSTAWTSLAVETAARRAADAVRRGEGPRFLELRTYRFRAHSMADPDLYRTKEEIEHWKERDPIALLEARMRRAKLLTDADLDGDRVRDRRRARRSGRGCRSRASGSRSKT